MGTPQTPDHTPGHTPDSSSSGPAASGAPATPLHASDTECSHQPGQARAGCSCARAQAGPPPGTTVDRRVWPVDRRTVRVAGRDPQPADPSHSGLERRRGPGRRLSDFTKSAEEGEMNQEQFLFLMAIEAFKKANARPYPTWTDVLEVVRLLGYRKTMPMELTLNNAEDWREEPTTPSNVRPARWHERAA